MMSKVALANRSKPARPAVRKSWLGSGSVLASATALVALSTAQEAQAQSRLNMNALRMHSAPQEMAASREAAARRPAPSEVKVPSVPIVPQVSRGAPVLPNVQSNQVAPSSQQQIVIAPVSAPAPVPVPTAGGAAASGAGNTINAPAVSSAGGQPTFISTQNTLSLIHI